MQSVATAWQSLDRVSSTARVAGLELIGTRLKASLERARGRWVSPAVTRCRCGAIGHLASALLGHAEPLVTHERESRSELSVVGGGQGLVA